MKNLSFSYKVRVYDFTTVLEALEWIENQKSKYGGWFRVQEEYQSEEGYTVFAQYRDNKNVNGGW